MKYIKRFLESIENISINDIEEFCANNLAYLIDAGFNVEVEKQVLGTSIIISFFNKDFTPFNWSDIDNDFIPFLILLDEKYSLFNNFVGRGEKKQIIEEGQNISVKYQDDDWGHFRIDDMDNINKEIRSIYIRLRN